MSGLAGMGDLVLTCTGALLPSPSSPPRWNLHCSQALRSIWPLLESDEVAVQRPPNPHPQQQSLHCGQIDLIATIIFTAVKQ